MFDEFVDTSRSSGTAHREQRVGFEPSNGGPSTEVMPLQDPVTALETGFVSSDMQEASSLPPIFALGRVQYAFPAPLALLTVSNNILTMCLYAYPPPRASLMGQQYNASYPSAASAVTPPPRLVRIDLDDPERTEEAEVPLPPLPRSRNVAPPDPTMLGPYKMFCDPSGKHIVVGTRNGDNFYWTSGLGKRARVLNRFKGIVIESIAWNPFVDASNASSSSSMSSSKRQGNVNGSVRGPKGVGGAGASLSNSTRQILIGTSTGDIYEAVLTTTASHADADEGDFLDRLARRTAGATGSGPEIDKALRHIFTLHERQPITGMHVDIFPSATSSTTSSSSRAASAPKAVVVVTSSTRIYEFVGTLSNRNSTETHEGEGTYEKLFEAYKGDAVPNLKSELPGDLPYSELHMWTPISQRHSKALAWLTGPGIYHGLLSFGEQQVGDSVIDSANLLPYPAVPIDDEDHEGQGETISEIPLSIALTEFHFILLYRDRIMAISSLDDRVVYQEDLPLKTNEYVIGTTVDVARKTYWVYTDASIFELVVRHEDRDVWLVYLQRHAYDTALRYAKTPSQRDEVLSAQGDAFFEQGKQIQAAQCYAKTFKRTFEEIVLRFIDADEKDALRYYLVSRLERLRKSDLTQRMMLATWLVEIYLAKINELEDVASASAASENVENYNLERTMLEDELKQFLVTYRDNLDSKTIFGLIKRHGRVEFMLHYAKVTRQIERIVRHWTEEEDWDRAIEAVVDSESLDLYYRFATVLIRHRPEKTVDSWIRQPALQPRRLIPAMLQEQKGLNDTGRQTIRYLQHVIRESRNSDPAVHNFLLSALARAAALEDGEDAKAADRELLNFIANAQTRDVTGRPYYDLDYALRTCSDNGRLEACVRIFAKMENYESAVDLALEQGDVELACEVADMVEGGTRSATRGSDETEGGLKKKLWKKTAEVVVKQNNDIKAAMEFLSRTNLLSVEDILPFFPDFAVIDDFKDEICLALEGYAGRIEELKTEMDEATQSAESIREDAEKLSRRFVTVVKGQDVCWLCKAGLVDRQFYIFSCRHGFHADCLVAETKKHLKARPLRRILELQQQLSSLTSGVVPSLPPQYASVISSAPSSDIKSGVAALEKGQIAFSASTGLGLDKLRDLVSPDAIVGAISAGVSVGVAGGKNLLAPLDPFADPRQSMGSLGAKSALAITSSPSQQQQQQQQLTNAKAGDLASGGRLAEKQELIEDLRDELDGLVASACLLCEGSVATIARPFVNDREAEIDEWAL